MNSPFGTIYDVAVLGGGMCGVAAALKAAQCGKRVLQVERRAALGWEATSAFNCRLDRGQGAVARLIHQRMNGNGCLCGSRLDVPSLEMLLLDLLDEAGVDLLLFSQPLATAAMNGAVQGVWIGNKEGEQFIRAKAFIDSSENGLLWRQNGAPMTPTPQRKSRQSVFFNFVDEVRFGLSGAAPQGVEELRICPSVRRGEVCLEFTLPEHSNTRNRAVIEDVIAFARESIPGLADAMVTHASFEPFPLDAPAYIRDSSTPELPNLFGAGVWAIVDARERCDANTLCGRLNLGERAADHAIERSLQLPEPDANYDPPPSEVVTEMETDLLIAGGGAAGELASLSTGREGVNAVLLEASCFLGGMVTGSNIHTSWHGVPGGLQDELEAVGKEKAVLYCGSHRAPRFHPVLGKIALETWVLDAGVQICYGATTIGVERDGDRIEGVYAATPEGKAFVKARFVIDSTGDGDVAAKAGADCIVGRRVDGVIHPYSQCGQMLRGNGIGGNNFDAGHLDTASVRDLTRGRVHGVREVQKRFPRTVEKDSALMYICPLLGIRQGRQVVGDFVQTMEDQVLPRHYDDCIGWSSAKYDCHSQDPENQQDLPIFWVWLLGNRERGMGGEIPYRVMLPKGLANVLVACRAASCDDEASYQLRTIRNQYRMGEAAGMAVSMCLRDGVDPRQIDVAELQSRLRQSGALDEERNPGRIVPQMDLEEIRAGLHSKRPSDAVWNAAWGGAAEEALLLELVEGDDDAPRFWSAVALAWRRHRAAVPVLMQAVDERMALRPDFTPHSRNMRPLWQSCIPMLGRIGDERPVDQLIGLLQTERDFDVLIAAIRALGRIGDKRSADAIEAVLEREGVDCVRRFQQTLAHAKFPSIEDGRWQLELASVDVLQSFGRRRDDVLARYDDDPRFSVRNYAQMLRNSALCQNTGGHSI